MDITDLDSTGKVALVALLRSGTQADGALSDSENAMFDMLAKLLGEEAYNAAIAVGEEHVPDVDDGQNLRALLAQVKDRDAQELIYGTLLQVLTSETVNPREDQVLELASTVWNIKPEFEGFPPDTDESDPNESQS